MYGFQSNAFKYNIKSEWYSMVVSSKNTTTNEMVIVHF